ncbi:hypothetical protein [Pantanalinema sp. GBBB05]|uniref:hypothetical protein n=1 Tax=Pantanalinema sp. GBBB05 TaxID=2604139 RepID=UPI001E118E1D|nr:hypothetical protein [Pantanalinema sp. GBBB05]
MRQIQKLGSCMATDADGYLINECRWEQIQPPWLKLVADLRDACVSQWGDRLHSLYLRGSVPRGLAIPEISDLDSIAILQDEPGAESAAAIRLLQTELTRRHPFCSKVEVVLLSLTDMQSSTSLWAAIVQTQGLCIYGDDLRSQLPRCKPGMALISHAFDLADDLADTQAYLRQLPSYHPQLDTWIKTRCSWLARRMVRTGFELVMTSEGTFTRDLYPCYESFSRYFPAQEPLMRKALELAIQPSANRAGILMFFSHFGSWLVETVASTFPAA